MGSPNFVAFLTKVNPLIFMCEKIDAGHVKSKFDLSPVLAYLFVNFIARNIAAWFARENPFAVSVFFVILLR